MNRYIVLLIPLLLFSCSKPNYKKSVGEVFGTYYAVTYEASADYTDKVLDVFSDINSVFSTFDSLSVISQINKCDSFCVVPTEFIDIFKLAGEVSDCSGGAFDMSVVPLVNLWGFGYDPQKSRNDADVLDCMQYVGYKKLRISGDTIFKADSRMALDASAIAKGYACDKVADCFNNLGIKNYLIDIGGEIVAKGVNPRGKLWRIGISKPIEDSNANDLQTILSLDNQAIATSGNYRQFYITKERKVTHTIDPRTGYPVDKKVLSASVISSSCAFADAVATAMMVIGDTTEIAEFVGCLAQPIEYYLIVDEGGEHREVRGKR